MTRSVLRSAMREQRKPTRTDLDECATMLAMANDPDDREDRNTILERRKLFIVSAISGLSLAGIGACGDPQPCLDVGPVGGEGGTGGTPQPCLDAPPPGGGGAGGRGGAGGQGGQGGQGGAQGGGGTGGEGGTGGAP